MQKDEELQEKRERVKRELRMERARQDGHARGLEAAAAALRGTACTAACAQLKLSLEQEQVKREEVLVMLKMKHDASSTPFSQHGVEQQLRGEQQ